MKFYSMPVFLRRLAQAIFFILFVGSFISLGRHLAWRESGLLIFQFDPALALTTMISSRSWMILFLPALIVAILTVIFGRFFCGWVCPLGASLDLFHFLTGFIKRRKISHKLKSLKYILLSVLIISAFLGWQWSGYVNPFSILFRAISLGVEKSSPALIAWASLAAIFLLELLDRRLWCRYLCPSGALMGLLAQFSWWRRVPSELCPQCGACTRNCPAFDDDEYFHPSECYVCLECIKRCGKNLVQFKWRKPSLPKFDVSRRTFLASLGGGLLVPAAAYAFTKKKSSSLPSDFLRPPGVKSENDFLNACVRCGACIQTCPTRGLQPAMLEAGIEGIFSPRLVPHVGYCGYNCNACGQACPTGAIPLLSLQEKQQQILGKAQVDMERCIGCGKCVRICPVRAIGVKRRYPYVKKEKCIGCGACEYHCPLTGDAAIRVFSEKGRKIPATQA